MPSIVHLARGCTLHRHSLRFAAIISATLLAAPLAPALAQTSGAMSSMQSKAATHEETVDQRIATLRSELKITPAEESDWQAVAQTMKDNAAAMEKMASDKTTKSDETMSAVEDLHTYAQFAEAHVEHLKLLTMAFETLYNKMPDDQKKLADQVFARSRHEDTNGQG
jgi:chromosome segregation ATPase